MVGITPSYRIEIDGEMMQGDYPTMEEALDAVRILFDADKSKKSARFYSVMNVTMTNKKHKK